MKMTEEEKKVQIEMLSSKTCAYCPAARKMIKKSEKIYPKQLNFFEIDIESVGGRTRAQIFGVQGTPAIAINGILVFRGVPPSQTALNREIEKYLSEEEKAEARKIEKRRKDQVNMMYN